LSYGRRKRRKAKKLVFSPFEFLEGSFFMAYWEEQSMNNKSAIKNKT